MGYGFDDGSVGVNCNERYNEACDQVFRAQATTSVSTTWFSLFLAWELMHFRRSFFHMQPKSKRYFTQWIFDVRCKKFLIWINMFGFVSVFALLYIPGIIPGVFGHTGIT